MLYLCQFDHESDSHFQLLESTNQLTDSRILEKLTKSPWSYVSRLIESKMELLKVLNVFLQKSKMNLYVETSNKSKLYNICILHTTFTSSGWASLKPQVPGSELGLKAHL